MAFRFITKLKSNVSVSKLFFIIKSYAEFKCQVGRKVIVYGEGNVKLQKCFGRHFEWLCTVSIFAKM